MPSFPFTAVAGQPLFKLALTLVAVNPVIGGVLVSGPRGSAKSTLARALADVMPEADNRLQQFVTLPLGATEEMLVGTLDLQQIIDGKNVTFQAGLLAKADEGILYVDEVNLLADNLVDLLLDVAASGHNVIERDGISHQHKAEFILLGTMNPDEGELRPQLLDRFGLMVDLSNNYSVEERMEIVSLRQQFDANPQQFIEQYHQAQLTLTTQIEQARSILLSIECDQDCRRMIAQRSHDAGVDGLRGDIVWYHAAVAHAALQQRKHVIEADVLAVEELVLGHRRKHDNSPPGSPPPPPPPSSKPFSRPQEKTTSSDNGDWGAMQPQQQRTADAVNIDLSARSSIAASSARKAEIKAGKAKGLTVGGSRQIPASSHKVNWFSTLVGSAGQWPISRLQWQKQRGGQPVLHLVLLDTSASTLKNQLFAKAKAVIVQIADAAYLKREHLAIVGFGNQQVETLLSSRRAPKALRSLLDAIPAGGGTPLVQALTQAQTMQESAVRKTPGLNLRSYIITDGKTTQLPQDMQLMGQVAVIDIEQSAVKHGRAIEIAKALDADYYPLLA